MAQDTPAQNDLSSFSNESPTLDHFLKNFPSLSCEEKLRQAVTFMRTALSQEGSPDFRGFWEVRKICLEVFKEEMPSATRSLFWEEYIELTREGRRLKNLLDEESAFAMEQIELAIIALEQEIEGYHAQAEAILSKTPAIELPQVPASLEKKKDHYIRLQQNLNLLNVYAARIHSLRKELIKTDMRIRQKNKFFERLSAMGDKVFPCRKELIAEISGLFLQDVDAFVQANFSEETFQPEKIRKAVFFFREEIKLLQAFAKVLTLNTQAFTKTRELLSFCWDKLKGMEKELKKEFTLQKQKSSENVLLVRQKIDELKEKCSQGLAGLDALKLMDDILRWMRDVELTRADVQLLKGEIHALRVPIQESLEKQEEEKRQEEDAHEQKRRLQVQELKGKIDTLKEQVPVLSAEVLEAEVEGTKQALNTLPLTKVEKQMLDRSLKGIREQIEEKRERALLELSADDRAALDQLREVLSQRKIRRQQIKAQVEEYRKILGGSTLDLQKAMEFSELMNAERDRLEKIDEAIQEIEVKIRSLKNR